MPLKDGSDIRIASVDGRPKFLFLTGMLNASGIHTEIGNYKISIPGVAIEDANFDRAMLKDTFGNSGLTLPDRVGRFSAKRVSAPEIKIVQTVTDGDEQNILYKDVTLEDVRQGQVARYSAGSTAFDFAVDVPGEDGEKVRDKMAGTWASPRARMWTVYSLRVFIPRKPALTTRKQSRSMARSRRRISS